APRRTTGLEEQARAKSVVGGHERQPLRRWWPVWLRRGPRLQGGCRRLVQVAEVAVERRGMELGERFSLKKKIPSDTGGWSRQEALGGTVTVQSAKGRYAPHRVACHCVINVPLRGRE